MCLVRSKANNSPILKNIFLLISVTETGVDFIFLGSKITADGDCSHKIKRYLLLGRKTMTNLDSVLKKNRDITLLTKVCLVKAMVFPVAMCGCESWTIKKLKWSDGCSVVPHSVQPYGLCSPHEPLPSWNPPGKNTGVGCYFVLQGTFSSSWPRDQTWVSCTLGRYFFTIWVTREAPKKNEHRRIDAFEFWCWSRLLRVPLTARRLNQSILKEINPENSLESLMLKLKLQHFGHLMWRALEKTLMLGKTEDRWRRGWQRKMVGWHHSLSGHESEQSPGDSEGQGSLACCSPWGSQSIRNDLATEQQQYLWLKAWIPSTHPPYHLQRLYTSRDPDQELKQALLRVIYH